MRTKFCITIILTLLIPSGVLLSNSFANESKVKTYIEARGFVAPNCYKHKAIRHCDIKNLCNLEVFPNRTSAIHLPLKANSELVKNQATTDFGIFTFKLSKSEKEANPVAEIIAIERFPLNDYFKNEEDSYVAKKVTCK